MAKTPLDKKRWLILAGTKEARDFISHWRQSPQVKLVASLKGITKQAPDLQVETRLGGFSYEAEDGTPIDGITAMASYLKAQAFDALIDITHPFSAQISRHAKQAAALSDVPYFQFLRAPWQPLADDEWHYHDSWEALYQAVATRHLFIAGGHEALASLPASYQGQMTARMIEPPQAKPHDLPDYLEILLGHPARQASDEAALFKKHGITAVAAKLSGGKASAAKLAAARQLGLAVHLVKRPVYEDGYYDDMRALHKTLSQRLSAS